MSNKYKIKHGLKINVEEGAENDSAIMEMSSSTQGFLPPRMTTAERDAISSPATGLQVFNTTTNKLNVYSGSAWEEAGGSGAGGINYIDASDAESGTTGWATYDDGAAAAPVDGTGGATITTTWTQNTSSPLRGDADFLLTKDAADRQGEGVSYDFTIDAADKAKVLRISFDYLASANFEFNTGTSSDPSDVVVYVYDVTNSTLIQPTQFCLDGSGKFISEFQSASDSTSYRLILHIATANASAWTLQIDNVQVGPREIARGPVVTDWEQFTMTGTWTTNTTYEAWKRRVGANQEIRFKISTSGAPDAVTLDINLPSTIDTDALIANGSEDPLGYAGILDSGTFVYDAAISYASSTTARLRAKNASSTYAYWATVNATTPQTFASGDTIQGQFTYPVQGWSSNQVASSDFGGRVVAVTATTTTNFDSTEDQMTLTLVKDTAGMLASNTVTIPETGWYNVSFMYGGTHGATGGDSRIRIKLNGTTWLQHLITGTYFKAHNINQDAFLQAGDTLTFFGLTNANTMTNNGADYSRISVHKIQSPQTLMGGEVVAVRAIKNVDQNSLNNTDVVISYGSKQIDTHNAWNTSTNTFTAPVSGIYNIYTALRFTGTFAVSTFIRVRIRKNTVIQQEEYHICNGETDRTQSAGTILQLNAGETVDITGGSNDASFNIVNGGSIYTTINIHKVN